jgi:predicted PP-loop superfamily ATPase
MFGIMQKIIITFLILLSFFLSCSPIVMVLPKDVKKVYVEPVNNATSEIGLEVEFTNAIVEEMLKDGRAHPVNTPEESDGILNAVIERYIVRRMFTFGDDDSRLYYQDQYEIIIVVSVSFIDKNKSVVLWTKPNMKGIQIDYMTNLKSVRDNIWEKFSRDIIRRIVKVV